jgi:hypothetical protein
MKENQLELANDESSASEISERNIIVKIIIGRNLGNPRGMTEGSYDGIHGFTSALISTLMKIGAL